MGTQTAMGFANAVNEGSMPLEAAIAYHLQTNHYPPVHTAFVDVALEAINLADAGDYGMYVDYPNGKRGTVAQVIEGLHLDCFLERGEDEFEDEDFETQQVNADSQHDTLEDR